MSTAGFPPGVPGDKVSVVCPTCNKRLLVPASSIGKQGRCPSCKAVFPLEQVFEAETVQPTPFASGDLWGSAAPASTQQTFQQPAYPQQASYGQQPASNDMWGGTATSSTSSNPFGETNTATTTNPYASPQFNSSPSYSAYQPKPKGQFWDSSILGGMALMAIAVVWFFGGLAANIIFFYPPILFIIGLVVMIKGLASGSIAGR